jgi:CRP-like cAMP-binding protein
MENTNMTSPTCNHLLNALPIEDYERLVFSLEPINLKLGDVLYESGDIPRYMYFPTSAIISLIYGLENGASAEIAVVGNEGILGIALIMGGNTTPSRAVVRNKGKAYRLSPQVLLDEFQLGGAVQNLLLRYTQALITQMTQTAVCNRHHTVEQQLCRWLLHSLDRLTSNRLDMTQELIASMLGVRREGVTEAAGRLQREGIISYSRGRIEVLDTPQLERPVCECYQVVKKEFERLLPSSEERSSELGENTTNQTGDCCLNLNHALPQPQKSGKSSSQ